MRVGHQHRVINRRNIDPYRAKILASYFMFWPIFMTDGSSSRGFQRQQRCSSQVAHRPIRQSQRDHPSSHLCGQGNIAGLPGLDAERDPNKIGAACRSAPWFRYPLPHSRARRAGRSSVQRRHVADAFVFARIKWRGFGGSGACCDRRFCDLWHTALERLGDALGQGAEFHLGEESEQFSASGSRTSRSSR